MDDADAGTVVAEVHTEIRVGEVFGLENGGRLLQFAREQHRVRGSIRPGITKLTASFSIRRRDRSLILLLRFGVRIRRRDLRHRRQRSFPYPGHGVEVLHRPRGDHDSRHRVIVGMEDWIKLVIMATSAADGLGEKSLGKHVDLLVDDVDQHFFFVGFCEDLWPQR